MEGLPGKCEMRLADRLRLGGMRVDELRDLGRQRLPVVDELAFGDQLADPGADEVHAEDRPRLPGSVARGRDDLRRPLGLQYDALSIAAEVVGELRDLDTAGGRGRRRDPDRGDLRVAVGDPGDTVIVDRRDIEPG